MTASSANRPVVIDEAMIARLVRAFYARAREDGMLGPVFAAHVENWDDHIERISAFWSSVMLRTGRYQGRPVPAHARLPVDAAHFDRWLALFEETAADTCGEDAGSRFIERARLIAQSLEIAVATHQGVMVPPGGRYHRQGPDARSGSKARARIG